MGIFAETSFTIECNSAEAAQKVYDKISKMSKNGDELGNFVNIGNLEICETSVYGNNSSGRVQNLSYQCQKIWESILTIDGVIDAYFPFMIEGEGEYYSKN